MNKYSRHQSVISRNADESIGEDHWLKQFQKTLEKGAVQPRNSPNNFLYQQITEIMQGKSKYPSVEAAVKDMQERSGLIAYLNNLNKNSEEADSGNTKTAEDVNEVIHKHTPVESVKEVIPVVIKKCPSVKKTIENIISGSKGNLSLPAIIGRVRSIHSNDVSDAEDWDDPDLMKYVSQQNLSEKQKYPGKPPESNLGKSDSSTSTDDIDPANVDAFYSLNPAKV